MAGGSPLPLGPQPLHGSCSTHKCRWGVGPSSCGFVGMRVSGNKQTPGNNPLCLCRTLPAAGAQAVLVLGWSRQPGTIQLKITPVNKTLPPGLARRSGGTGSWDVPGCGSTVGLAPCRGALGWCHQLQACPSALSTPLPSSWGHSGPWHPHCRQQNVTSACWRVGSPGDVVMAHSSGMPQPPHAELCAGSVSPPAAWDFHTWHVSQVTAGRVWDTGSRSRPRQPHAPGQRGVSGSHRPRRGSRWGTPFAPQAGPVEPRKDNGGGALGGGQATCWGWQEK